MKQTWAEEYVRELATSAIPQSVGKAVESALSEFLPLLPEGPIIPANLELRIDMESIEVRCFADETPIGRAAYVSVGLRYEVDHG